MKINPKLYSVSLIIYCIIIFIFSSIPAENLPSVDVEYSDKIIHIIVYGILFVLFFYTLKNQTKNIRLQKFALEYALLFTALYGITDEIHQYFVPNRSCEFFDWVADVGGGLIVYLGFKFFYIRKKSLIVGIFLFFIGCGSSSYTNKNDVPNITITEVDSWIDLMPVIDERKNNFGFLISLKIETKSKDTNYSIDDFTIYLDKDTLHNKKIERQMHIMSDGSLKLDIFQSRNEMYLRSNNKMPQDAKFMFKVYGRNQKSKTFITPTVKIKKVY